LDTVASCLADSESWCKPGFKHGETLLISMSNQLKYLELYSGKGDSLTYLTDGISKLFSLKNLEILFFTWLYRKAKDQF
jgi:hypothetical protein